MKKSYIVTGMYIVMPASRPYRKPEDARFSRISLKVLKT